MKKVTFLLLHLNYGGLERQVITLANELAKSYKVEFIVLYDILNGKSFYNLNENINVKFILNYGPIRICKLKEYLKKFNFIKFIKSLFQDIKLIHTKYFKIKKIVDLLDTDILISSRIEFSKQIKRKDITTISQEHSYINEKKYIKKIRKSFNNIKYLIVMTDKAKQDYEKWLEGYNSYTKIIKISNAIKKNDEKSDLEGNQIISIGRLEEVKDFETLIDVFSMCLKQKADLTLKIVGDGSQKEKLIKKCKDLNISNKVNFVGKLDDEQIKKELLNSSIFVLTSKSESFSLVLLEASSFGIPCICFDVDVGPREIIENNVNGILIEDRNKEKMKDAIISLINNKEKRNTLGNNAKENAKKYYISNTVKDWEKLLD